METEILNFKQAIEEINQAMDKLDNAHQNKKVYNMIFDAKYRFKNLRGSNTTFNILELMVNLKNRDYSKFWDLSYILNLYLKDNFNFSI